MSIVSRYAINYDDAVEVVNDSFLKIFKGLDQFNAENNHLNAAFAAWLKRIFITTSIDYVRKNEKRLEKTIELSDKEFTMLDSDENGEDIMSYKEIIECIKLLSPACRTVFNLFVIEGYTHEQISQELKISVSSSKTNLFKARQKLQDMLKKNQV